MVEIQIPEKVNKIIHTLQEHGYEAYAVGGCVRDSFLGREPMDWDITTSAMPEETKALFLLHLLRSRAWNNYGASRSRRL